VGEKEEAERVADLIRRADMKPGFIGLVSVSGKTEKVNGFIGHLDQMKEIISMYKIDEVIFCAKDMPAQQIIDKMSEMNPAQLEMKIAPPESLSIIGSKSINTTGDVYIIEINSITRVNNKRSKRFLDIVTALALFALSPLVLITLKRPNGFYKNIAGVLIGKISWVGYRMTAFSMNHKLPFIKKGVLNPTDLLSSHNINEDTIDRLNLLYARDYKISNDLTIILKGFRNLGRKV
jgi:O-antigen biosynthesis protein